MNTITQDEFEQLCVEVAADARELFIAELFRRICRHIGLDPEMQRIDCFGSNSALTLAQTLDGHMWPDFHYSELLSKYLPPARN